MDYGRLSRKDLQTLCKEHGIPANKTNVFMAEALGALLNAPKESEETREAIPDAAEVVKSRENLKRAARSHRVAEPVLEARKVDDLAAEFAKSTLDADPQTATVANSNDEAVKASARPEVAVEPVHVRRSSRTQAAKVNFKSLNSLTDAAPAPAEPTALEVVLPVENTSDLPTLHPRFKPNRIFLKDVGRPLLRPATILDVLPHEDNSPATMSDEDEAPEPLSAVAEIVVEGNAGAAKTKKSRVNRRKPKKQNPVSPISVNVLEDAIAPPTSENMSSATIEVPESPTLGLTSQVLKGQEIQTAASISPVSANDAFEFHTVPESIAEIMTTAEPLPEATKVCQHRVSRRTGKDCKSCASNKKLASLTQEVLQAIDVQRAETLPVVEEAEHAEVLTPVKTGEDKENVLKNLEGASWSIRKLQKEVVKRGLSKRNNSKIKV